MPSLGCRPKTLNPNLEPLRVDIGVFWWFSMVPDIFQILLILKTTSCNYTLIVWFPRYEALRPMKEGSWRIFGFFHYWGSVMGLGF